MGRDGDTHEGTVYHDDDLIEDMRKDYEKLEKYVNVLSVKYFEIRDLIEPFSEDFMDFGQPDSEWLEKVRDKFFEMDELVYHHNPSDEKDPFR